MIARHLPIMQCGSLVIPAQVQSRLMMMDQAALVASMASNNNNNPPSSTETLSNATASSSPSVAVAAAAATGGQQRFAVLSYEQVNRLDKVMDAVVPIHGRGNFPTLEIKLKELVQVVRAKLERDGVKVRDMRVNGGAASYILASDGAQQPYNDLDLIFAVDLSTQRHFERVKTAVLESLLDFLPEGANKKRISSCSLKEAYVHKMVKVTTEGDRWSLISLSNHGGRNVELKFVDTMRRQFEFSVDSFQIVLDSLLVFYECAEMPMADNFYPTVVGESVFGDFHESLYHLNQKLISTRNPEEIRGGGLLKYCNLLVRGYKAVSAVEIKSLERYMCSRFFIDFSDLQQQQHKLENYLTNHFGLWSEVGGGEGQGSGGSLENEEEEEGVGERWCLTYDYLITLYRVVDESTVCLMNHERRQTLNLIEELACQVYFQEQHRLYQKQQQHSISPQSVSSSSSSSFNPMHHHYANAFYYTPFVHPPPPPPPSNHHHHHHHHHPPPPPPYSHHHHYAWMPCA